MMQIRYNVTIEDLVVFNRFHCRNSPAIKRSKWTSILFVCVTIIIGSLVIPLDDEVSRPIVIVAAVVFAVLFAVIFNWRYLVALDRQARRIYREGNNKGAFGEHELEIDDDGLVERTEVNENRYAWRGVERIIETDSHAFIYISALLAHVIPRGSIVEGNFDAFIARTRQLCETHKEV
jgi:hypothetical protein